MNDTAVAGDRHPRIAYTWPAPAVEDWMAAAAVATIGGGR